MSEVKCKVCGAQLNTEDGNNQATCLSCGVVQSVPTIADEETVALYNQANAFRNESTFVRAEDLYKRILAADDPDSPEGLWGQVLCHYGLVYSPDKKTGKHVPVCHRHFADPVEDNRSYRMIFNRRFGSPLDIYRRQGEELESLRKSMDEVIHGEKSVDVYIAYMEKDAQGRRTMDSLLAEDVEAALNSRGYHVYCEGKSKWEGLSEEAYKTAALNAAKMMIVFGSKVEFFYDEQLKKSWEYYLDLMQDGNKKLLTCCSERKIYSLPKGLPRHDFCDFTKVSGFSDLLREVETFIGPKNVAEDGEGEEIISLYGTCSSAAMTKVKRGEKALEQGNWEKAERFFDEALVLDSKSAESYIGKLLAKDHQPNFDAWVEQEQQRYAKASESRMGAFVADDAYVEEKAERYSIEGYLSKEEIRALYVFDDHYVSSLQCRKNQKATHEEELAANEYLTIALSLASMDVKELLENALKRISDTEEQRITEASMLDEKIIQKLYSDYMDLTILADAKVVEKQVAADHQRDRDYKEACSAFEASKKIASFEALQKKFEGFHGYKDSDAYAKRCGEEILRIHQETAYQKLIERMENVANVYEWMDLKEGFLSLDGYKDSKALAAECAAQVRSIHTGRIGKKYARTLLVILILCVLLGLLYGGFFHGLLKNAGLLESGILMQVDDLLMTLWNVLLG